MQRTRPVFESPIHTYAWESISLDTQKEVLSQLLRVLAPVGQYRRIKQENRERQRKGLSLEMIPELAQITTTNILVGLNRVSRHLVKTIHEQMSVKEHPPVVQLKLSASGEVETSVPEERVSEQSGALQMIFACTGDIDVKAFTVLVSLAHHHKNLILCPLPAGAEAALSAALAIKHVSCIGLKACPMFMDFLTALKIEKNLSYVEVPWLKTHFPVLQPLRIRFQDTTRKRPKKFKALTRARREAERKTAH